ncbi:hypothetical protein CHS0354_000019 [Potamilus streckersoni]|uniref:THD domain-containing protein n=1 Tax=Potamilus streckersoni TaxID=2493646 RepID=A0AAE0WEQ8_9BIVA|nr:hypothetical protein CHS0354_000019 [Potamilus streckersoni]
MSGRFKRLKDRVLCRFEECSAGEIGQVDIARLKNGSIVEKVFLIVSALINIALLVWVIYSGISQGHSREENKAKKPCTSSYSYRSICVNCGDLDKSSATFSKNNLNLYLEKEWRKACATEDLCCTENVEYINHIAKIFMLQMQAHSETNVDKVRPAAHVFLDVEAMNKFSSLRWTLIQGFGTAFQSSSGILDNNTSLVVPAAGDYFLYSFITFKSRTGFEEEEGTISHSVYRERQFLSVTTKQLLLIDQQRQMGDNSFQSSYLSSVLRLRTKDRIFTEVSDVSAVYGSVMSNFFGMYKI